MDDKNMTKGKMRRLAVCAAAAVILAVTVLTAGPVRASQSGFAKISYEKMYLALNDVNNVIQAYQDTSDGSVAYCLNSALESPDGGQSYGNAGNGTGRISEAGMAAVRLVIGDGYPLNARYWRMRSGRPRSLPSGQFWLLWEKRTAMRIILLMIMPSPSICRMWTRLPCTGPWPEMRFQVSSCRGA